MEDQQVADKHNISYGTAQDILTNRPAMRRVPANKLPRLQVPEQKHMMS